MMTSRSITVGRDARQSVPHHPVRLEQNGLVVRRRYAEAPPRVEYELTGPGRGLIEPLSALGRWTERYADEVLDAREGAVSGR
ncbi:hypothetical protein GCM10009736_48770 [Actinomadura bangladeshensis]